MAVIQIRSGTYADYDPTKMHSAELAAILSGDPATSDGKSLNISFGAGDSKRVLTNGDLNSPAFTGTPTVPTAEAGTNTTQIASTAFVNSAITAAQKTLEATDNGSGVVTLSLV